VKEMGKNTPKILKEDDASSIGFGVMIAFIAMTLRILVDL